MIVEVAGGAYTLPNKDLAGQRCVNYYPSLGPTKEARKWPKSLRPTEGYDVFSGITGSVVRGIFNYDNIVYTVVDNTLYSLNATGETTNRGTLLTSIGKVEMEVNGNGQIFISDVVNGYVYDIADATFTRVTDADFLGAESLAYQDGYFLAVWQGRVYFSNLNDGLTWTGVDVFTPTYKADKARAIKSFRTELFIFGDETTEIYYNDGATPFSRRPSSAMHYGIVSAYAATQMGDAILWVAKNTQGYPLVMMVDQQFQSKIISTESISSQLENAGVLEDVYTFGMIKNGHMFFVITIPNTEQTFVYDMATDEWH